MSKSGFLGRCVQWIAMITLMVSAVPTFAQTQPDDTWLVGLTLSDSGDEVLALKRLLTKAKAGDLSAQHGLGEMLLQIGRTDDGVAWLKYAAYQDYAPSKMTLAELYLGQLTQFDRDIEQAVYWLEKAAQHADTRSEAAFALAELYSTENEVYERGAKIRIIPADFEKARHWYEAAAQSGHATAQLKLGMMYLNAKSILKDSVQAFKWILLAAENGEPSAAEMAGLMYDTGDGVTQSNERALFWYAKGAQNYVDFYGRFRGNP